MNVLSKCEFGEMSRINNRLYEKLLTIGFRLIGCPLFSEKYHASFISDEPVRLWRVVAFSEKFNQRCIVLLSDDTDKDKLVDLVFEEFKFRLETKPAYIPPKRGTENKEVASGVKCYWKGENG